jgi:recombination protein RecT
VLGDNQVKENESLVSAAVQQAYGSRALAQDLHSDLTRMEDEFAKVLPPQISSAKFVRCLMTAVQLAPALLQCNRQTLLGAAMQAAQDGLLPDGRYGVIVPYNVKKGPMQVEKRAQWMPMVLGIYQKLHNSGKLRDISANVVYEKDLFDIVMGDQEEICHRPIVFSDRGKPIGVYAIANTKSGGTYRETMSVSDIEGVRSMSKSPNSPAWEKSWTEMAKVKVIKRLAKRLPLSTDDIEWLYREEEPAPLERQELLELERPRNATADFQTEGKGELDWDAISDEAEQSLKVMNETQDDDAKDDNHTAASATKPD